MRKRLKIKNKKARFIKKSVINYSKGSIALYLFILVIVLGAAVFSGFFNNIKPIRGKINAPTTITCCDTGDGVDCKPQEDKTKGQVLNFGGKDYGLIRSKVRLMEKNLHLKDSGEKFGNDPIILNSSDTHSTADVEVNEACNRTNPGDLYFKKTPPTWDYFMTVRRSKEEIAKYCTSTPNDELVFVCKNGPENCFTPNQLDCPYASDNIPCYGNDKSEYDVYFRLEDYQKSGIPDFIKNCDKSLAAPLPSGLAGQQKIIIKDNKEPQDNLQLKTFLIELQQSINPWLSPLCKPAIYLYPEKKTDVNVKIKPKGDLTLTIPAYPPVNGWKVLAYPNGKIESENKSYDYLYYEAQIPNELVDGKTDQGYVVKYEELDSTLKNLLPNLGLNKKESGEFLDYWLKVLPKSNYYFIGVVPQKLFDDISPLNINPSPDTIIRVILYFKPLDDKINVSPPNLTNIQRKGFTVVEWGGFFKIDSAHPFTCLM